MAMEGEDLESISLHCKLCIIRERSRVHTHLSTWILWPWPRSSLRLSVIIMMYGYIGCGPFLLHSAFCCIRTAWESGFPWLLVSFPVFPLCSLGLLSQWRTPIQPIQSTSSSLIFYQKIFFRFVLAAYNPEEGEDPGFFTHLSQFLDHCVIARFCLVGWLFPLWSTISGLFLLFHLLGFVLDLCYTLTSLICILDYDLLLVLCNTIAWSCMYIHCCKYTLLFICIPLVSCFVRPFLPSWH